MRDFVADGRRRADARLVAGLHASEGVFGVSAFLHGFDYLVLHGFERLLILSGEGHLKGRGSRNGVDGGAAVEICNDGIRKGLFDFHHASRGGMDGIGVAVIAV